MADAVQQANLAAGKAHHDKAAQMIMDLATAQVRNACDLGGHAARMGISASENPFKRLLGHETLARAWTAGHREASANAQ